MTIFTNLIDGAAEEADAYIKAVLELVGDQDPMEILAALPGALEERIANLTDEELRRPEAQGKWSVIEIVQHLADSDLVWAYRLRTVVAQDGVELTGYDQDAWARSLRYREANATAALAQFQAIRAANLQLLRSLTPSEMKHAGTHSERGTETIEHMVRLYAGHDLAHLRQLDRVLGGLG